MSVLIENWKINLPLLLLILTLIFLLWRFSRRTKLRFDRNGVSKIILEDDERVDWDIIKPGINTITLEGKKYLIIKVDKKTKTIWFKKLAERDRQSD